MRLKRLELFGFKSFADRTVLDYGQLLVGIVGPNGCGKSNVVDAVRWVLGETRPTSMRGGEMTDVIFKGSSSRSPLAVAEVTLVLDNTDATIEGRGVEVALTRRVYRSGEGEYLIDAERVRLKDVREILYGTGLGSRGYSVLEQGKIDAILSANPTERRSIFEEAAGISRYRQRKKESESRLDRVDADLLRIDDVLRELERRKRSLKIQAGKAERYREARERYSTEGLRLACHQAGVAKVRRGELSEVLAREEAQGEGIRERRNSAESGLGTREKEQEALVSEVERTSREAAEAGGELRALDERRTQLGARIDAWNHAAAEEGKRSGELERKQQERSAELAAFEAEIQSLTGKKESSTQRVAALEAEVATLSAQLKTCHEVLETQNDRCLGLLSEKTNKENHVEHLTQSLPPLEERTRRAEERRDEHRTEAQAAQREEGEASAALISLQEKQSELEEQRTLLQGELEGLDARHGEFESQAGEKGLEIARLQSRVEALCDWEQERAGLEAGARALFFELGEGRGPKGVSPERIAGLFADHLHPDTDAARAIDAALGARAQALVVGRQDDAERIVAWLKERADGRVSLVFGSGPRSGGEAPAEAPLELLSQPDVLGLLPQFARPESGFERLTDGLLGDVILVRGLYRARELSAAYPAWRFVTPEGDLVDVAGEIAGHVEVAQGPVGRRSFAASI
jgi:chromosome segregation protein